MKDYDSNSKANDSRVEESRVFMPDNNENALQRQGSTGILNLND